MLHELLPVIAVPALIAVSATTSAILALRVGRRTRTDFDASDAMADAHQASAFWRASFVAFIAAAMWSAIVSLRGVISYTSPCTTIVISGVALAFGVAGAYANRFFAASDPLSPISRLCELDIPIYRITSVGLAVASAVVALLIQLSAVLMYHSGGPPAAAELRERIACGRLALLSASILLITGVAEIYLRNDWPAHMSLPGSNPTAIHNIAVTLSIVSGALFSIVLLQLYVPVIVSNEYWIAQAAEAAHHAHPEIAMSSWLEQESLNRSLGATLLQIGAIVAPSLTALGLPGLLMRRYSVPPATPSVSGQV